MLVRRDRKEGGREGGREGGEGGHTFAFLVVEVEGDACLF